MYRWYWKRKDEEWRWKLRRWRKRERRKENENKKNVKQKEKNDETKDKTKKTKKLEDRKGEKKSKDHWAFTKTYSHPRVYLECLIRKNVLLCLQRHWMPQKKICSFRIADGFNYASYYYFFTYISTYMNNSKTFIEEPFRKYILHLFFFSLSLVLSICLSLSSYDACGIRRKAIS